MKRLRLLIFIGLVNACMCAGAAAHYKVRQKEIPVPIQSVSDIKGFVGDRMTLNRKYLKEFPIDRYIDFVVERNHTAWDWTKAEQHGKWIESAYLSAVQSGDTELYDKVVSRMKRMLASQEPDGYVGATAKSYRTADRPIRGMDPYELYFVFHALMTVYEETGDSEALDGVKKLGDYFIANFGPGKKEFWPSDLRAPENSHKALTGGSEFAGHAVHYSWEGTLLCDPMARLYEITGDRKYLDWSKWTVSNIDKWSGWDSFSRLDSVAAGTLTVDKLQPYVHSHTFHMNFMGFLRLYLISGDESLLTKVKGAWEDIYKRQMYITGGVSVAEHYEHDYVKPLNGNIIETCATMSWMQLTQMLLQITGEARYADAMERLMLNHVFAAQDSESGVCRYHTAPNGSKPDGWHGFFHGPDCCTASGHRIISLLPTFLYAQSDKELYINQYIDSKYTSDDITLELSGNYPVNEQVKIAIAESKPQKRALKLRLPSWCNEIQVTVNGESQPIVSDKGYLTIERRWKAGDEIVLHLPMEEHWIKRENHMEYSTYLLPNGEIMYNQSPADKVPYAFMRGPIVYALDMVWNKDICNDDSDISKDFRVDTSKLPTKIHLPAEGLMGPAFSAAVEYKGSPRDVVLVPFTNVSQWYRPNEPKPNPNCTAFTYNTWLYPIEDKTMVTR